MPLARLYTGTPVLLLYSAYSPLGRTHRGLLPLTKQRPFYCRLLTKQMRFTLEKQRRDILLSLKQRPLTVTEAEAFYSGQNRCAAFTLDKTEAFYRGQSRGLLLSTKRRPFTLEKVEAFTLNKTEAKPFPVDKTDAFYPR